MTRTASLAGFWLALASLSAGMALASPMAGDASLSGRVTRIDIVTGQIDIADQRVLVGRDTAFQFQLCKGDLVADVVGRVVSSRVILATDVNMSCSYASAFDLIAMPTKKSSASSEVVGTGVQGIVGTGIEGIVGTGVQGIVGTGIEGIVGTGVQGIVGTGIN